MLINETGKEDLPVLFDTHAHYDDEQFDTDRDVLLSSMPQNNIALILNPGCDVQTSQKAVDMAEKYPFMYAAVGIHPEQALEADNDAVEKIRNLARHPKIKAIGEIGLDYHYLDMCPKDKQKAVFRQQMALARSLKLPVIIHDREAHEDCLEIVKEFPDVTGVYHCYSGSLEMAKVLIKLGYMISFTGVITFKNAKKSADIIKYLPIESIMIETDSPYLAPEPFRGRRNSSLYVHYVAEKIAELKSLPLEDVINITAQNGKRFFGIE